MILGGKDYIKSKASLHYYSVRKIMPFVTLSHAYFYAKFINDKEFWWPVLKSPVTDEAFNMSEISVCCRDPHR